jgi:NADH-quinone oxidoreductase subunit J
MNSGAEFAFLVSAAAAVASALAMVTRRNAVVGAMWLIVTFFAVAVCYLLLSATFLAAIQVLVYAGAIMVLFVFVIMVLDVDATGRIAHRRPSRIGRLGFHTLFLGSAGFVGWVLFGTWARQFAFPGPELPAGFGTAESLGRSIFTRYLFPFEAISLLLLAAVVGAVVVARSRKEREEAARDLVDPAARRAAGLGAEDATELAGLGPTPASDFGQPSGTGHRGA